MSDGHPHPNPRSVPDAETSAASRATSAPRPAGKLAPALLATLIEMTLPPEVALGPRIGEDACAIEIEGGTLIAGTDSAFLAGERIAGTVR